MDRSEAEATLAQLGRQLARHRNMVADDMDAIRAVVKASVGVVPKARMAMLLGIDRSTVIGILGSGKGAS